MVEFYFVFHFSTPYVPFVPFAGPETELPSTTRRATKALIELRQFVADFIESFEPDTPQIWQWPRNVET